MLDFDLFQRTVIYRSNKMKARYLLIGVVVLFVAGMLTASSYAKIDPKTLLEYGCLMRVKAI